MLKWNKMDIELKSIIIFQQPQPYIPNWYKYYDVIFASIIITPPGLISHSGFRLSMCSLAGGLDNKKIKIFAYFHSSNTLVHAIWVGCHSSPKLSILSYCELVLLTPSTMPIDVHKNLFFSLLAMRVQTNYYAFVGIFRTQKLFSANWDLFFYSFNNC